MVSMLKQEILSNPFGDVQPILCIVQLKENEPFDSKLKEAYFYLTIGGNHSRQALQDLLQERPLLQKKPSIHTQIMCHIQADEASAG